MVSSFSSVYGYWQLTLLLLLSLGLIIMFMSLWFESRRNSVVTKFLRHKHRMENIKGVDPSDLGTKMTEYTLLHFSKTERAILASEGFIQANQPTV